jgi:hypothetical protein
MIVSETRREAFVTASGPRVFAFEVSAPRLGTTADPIRNPPKHLSYHGVLAPAGDKSPNQQDNHCTDDCPNEACASPGSYHPIA